MVVRLAPAPREAIARVVKLGILIVGVVARRYVLVPITGMLELPPVSPAIRIV